MNHNVVLSWCFEMEILSVSFKSEGQSIAAVLEIPDDPNPPAVIYSHGFTSSGTKEWQPDGTHKIVKTAARLRQLGFVVLRFDFRGLGRSEGEFMEEGVSGEAMDLMAAVDFLIDKGYGKISLLGSSVGGAISILCYDYVKPGSMVLWNPVTDLRSASIFRLIGHSEEEVRELVREGESTDMVEDGERYELGMNFLRELVGVGDGSRVDLDVPKMLTKVECPTLVIHGEKDEVLPVEKCREAFETIPATLKEFREIKGAGHGFYPAGSEYEREAVEATVRWFNKYGR